jgi:uncharacterized protein YjbI with pentapeptide repeats
MSEYTTRQILEMIQANGGPEDLDLSGKDLSGIDLGWETIQVELEILRKENLRVKPKPTWWTPEPTNGVNLSQVNLSGANLGGANLCGADLRAANLREADLGAAYLAGSDLSKADLYGANLKKADLYGSRLREANLRVVYLHEARLASSDLYRADMRDASLTRANLKGAILREANLERAELFEAELEEVDLQETNLAWANLFGANLKGVDLTTTILRGVNLEEANLRYANLQRVDLNRVNLRSADLFGADMRLADLAGANLEQARLTLTNLIGARLEGAYLHGAELDGAYVRDAVPKKAIRSENKPRTSRGPIDISIPSLSQITENLKDLLRFKRSRTEPQSLSKLSVAHPRLLAKRYASKFLVHVYLDRELADVKRRLKVEFEDSKFTQVVEDIDLLFGQVIEVELHSPDIEFSGPVAKKLDKEMNEILFTGKPKESCHPGKNHTVLLSIKNKETGEDLKSISFDVHIVDYAFDHISRPLLSHVAAGFSGFGAVLMFALTMLEQIDTTFGLTSGAAAGAVAAAIYARYTYLFRQTVKSKSP